NVFWPEHVERLLRQVGQGDRLSPGQRSLLESTLRTDEYVRLEARVGVDDVEGRMPTVGVRDGLSADVVSGPEAREKRLELVEERLDGDIAVLGLARDAVDGTRQRSPQGIGHAQAHEDADDLAGDTQVERRLVHGGISCRLNVREAQHPVNPVF